jgi:hypothetical protein
MTRWFIALSVALFIVPDVWADETVRLTQGEASIKATINGDVFAVMRFAPDQKKPYFLPVTGPNGMHLLEHAQPSDEPGVAGRRVFVASETAQLKVESDQAGTVSFGETLEVGTIEGDWLWVPEKEGWIHRSDVVPLAATVVRTLMERTGVKDRKDPLYYDHPHHKGVWASVDEVNGVKFWNEDGIITTESAEIVVAEGNPAVIKRVSHWLGKDEKPIVAEETTISLFANRLMVFDITFRAMQEEVTFGDTKEGMFGIRLPNSMRELADGGPVVSSEGEEGTRALWGKTARWIDYNGPIDGQMFGATVMDHPDNPRESRYHVRDYGLFTINPFGAESYTGGQEEARPLQLKKGETTRYRYGLWIHGAETDKEQVEQAYQQFVEYARQ